MSFYPNIPTIHITLDQGPTVSNYLSNMMIVILLTECFSERPTRYVYECWVYSLSCCIRIILYTVLHAIVFFIFLSQFIYSCVLSYVIVTLKSEGHWRSSKLVPFEFGFLFAFHSIYGSILHHFRNKARYYLNIVIFHTPLHLTPPLRDHRRNIAIPFGTEKLALWAIPDGEKTLRISINVSTAYRRVRVTGRRQT